MVAKLNRNTEGTVGKEMYAPARVGAVAEPNYKAAQKEHTERTRAAVETLAPPAGNVDMLLVGSPMPRSIGLCADFYNDVRALRLMMEKEVATIQARESEIKNHIIDNLSKSDDTGASGKRFRAQIVMKTVPQLADWAAFTGYVMEHDRFDLIQKRLGEKAVADMWESGEEIPGVAKFNTPTVSITKI